MEVGPALGPVLRFTGVRARALPARSSNNCTALDIPTPLVPSPLLPALGQHGARSAPHARRPPPCPLPPLQSSQDWRQGHLWVLQTAVCFACAPVRPPRPSPSLVSIHCSSKPLWTSPTMLGGNERDQAALGHQCPSLPWDTG
ncbi:hypothetical protein CALCODRAFT_122132 [Calocera cornea HHB12733]|uniref:Uncharacterized protein n=1 Tax=Calocera cornea HHB12733 TaxID=1353952 RepID=A0A165CYT4_9BASI|nr:hypothetical protein CALCODRAFT_122132 [Calocera cornea HHB12733]